MSTPLVQILFPASSGLMDVYISIPDGLVTFKYNDSYLDKYNNANPITVVAPDLGSDLLRIFSIDAKTSKLTEQEPFAVVPGIGPRHGSFYTPHSLPNVTVTAKNETVYFYLVSELANSVSSYKVTYGTTLEFEIIESFGILGNVTAPAGTAAAEALISVSPFPSHPYTRGLHTHTAHSPTTSSSTPQPETPLSLVSQTQIPQIPPLFHPTPFKPGPSPQRLENLLSSSQLLLEGPSLDNSHSTRRGLLRVLGCSKATGL